MGPTVLWAGNVLSFRPDKTEYSRNRRSKRIPCRFVVIDDSGDLSISTDRHKFSGILVALIVGDVLLFVCGSSLFQNDTYLLAFHGGDIVEGGSWRI